MKPLNIVQLGPEHVNGLRRALDSVAREGRYIALTEAPKLIEVALFADMLARNGCPQVVALDDKAVVGWCDIRPHGAQRGELGMGVVASHRRRGLGQRLLSACLERSPYPWVELSVFASNTAAIALYEKNAFKRTGERTVQLGDTTIDAIVMLREHQAVP